MLRINTHHNSEGAKRYFDQELKQHDYYANGIDSIGTWHGKGAALLGLYGEVQRDQFHQLCDNLNPETGKHLTAKSSENRRVGFDLNFHCPKSVSLLHAHTQDPALEAAFQESVRETMQMIEEDALTRVRKGGQNHSRETGNLVWGEFTHHTARPVDGKSDPHLHAHCFAFNATFDPAEKKWKALDPEKFWTDAPFYEALFHNKLAGKLKQMGYGIDRNAKGWEIAHIPQDLIDRFSRRTDQIEKVAAALGITNAKAKSELGATTREAKQKDLSKDEQFAEWQERFTHADRACFEKAGKKVFRPAEITPQQAMEYSISHCFENASVVRERDIWAHALRFGVGDVNFSSIKGQVVEGLLKGEKDGSVFCTTEQVLQEEAKLIDTVIAGRGANAPIAQVGTALPLPDYLNVQQQNAVKGILNSTDQITALVGAAGTGKTTVLSLIADEYKKAGKPVFALAPSAQASHVVLKEAGFNAETVARYLVDEKLQTQNKGGLLLVDEASLLSIKDMQKVLDTANKHNNRVLYVGHTKQHRSVSRGDALRLLLTSEVLPQHSLSEVLRQKTTDYKKAVEYICEGQYSVGLAHLDRMEAIKEVDKDSIVSEFAQAVVKEQAKSKSPNDCLAVVPTHREADAVTQLIRQELKAQGRIGNEEFSRQVLVPAYLSEQQKRHSRYFEVGQVIEFTNNAPGFKKGQQLEVMARTPDGKVKALTHDKRMVDVPLQYPDRLQVFHKANKSMAKGDILRITQNGKTKTGQRLHNGAAYTVKNIKQDGTIQLNNGWEIAKDNRHITLGYTTTSHASQGKSVNSVLVLQTGASQKVASAEQFYVSVSRGKHKVMVFTDDKARLHQLAKQSERRTLGYELLPDYQYKGKENTKNRVSLLHRIKAMGRTAVQKVRTRLPEKQKPRNWVRCRAWRGCKD